MSQIDAGSLVEARLSNLGISRRQFASTAQVVGWHGAIQAQDLIGVLWSIALRRSDRVTVNHVRQSLEDERVVRTWPMRGTLHLVHPSSVRWIMTLLAPRMESADRRRMAQLSLTEDDVRRCREAVLGDFSDGVPRSRSELYGAFERSGVETSGQRGYHITTRLARDQLICGGPTVEGEPTFVLLDRWLEGTVPSTPADPLAALARTYIWSHGPVTPADFARWAGLTLGLAKTGFAANRQDCRVDPFQGSEYWSRGDTEFGPVDSQMHLLPGFDEFVLGYKDRAMFLAPEWQDRIAPGGNGVFRPTIVWEGRVIGTWSRAVSARTITLSADWWVSPTLPMREAFAERAEHFASFMDLPLRIST